MRIDNEGPMEESGSDARDHSDRGKGAKRNEKGISEIPAR